jgi:hypothetical protein
MTDTPTLTLWEWVNPQEFSPENGWVEDMIHCGRLRERTFKRPETYGELIGVFEGPAIWVEVTDG